jgi:hypothetical protein
MNLAKTLAVSAVAGMLMGSAIGCGGATPAASDPSAAGGKSSCSANAAPAGSGKSSCSANAAPAGSGKSSCSASAAPAPKY